MDILYTSNLLKYKSLRNMLFSICIVSVFEIIQCLNGIQKLYVDFIIFLMFCSVLITSLSLLMKSLCLSLGFITDKLRKKKLVKISDGDPDLLWKRILIHIYWDLDSILIFIKHFLSVCFLLKNVKFIFD